MLQPSGGLCYADLAPRPGRVFEAIGRPRESVGMNHRYPGHVLIKTTAESSKRKATSGNEFDLVGC